MIRQAAETRVAWTVLLFLLGLPGAVAPLAAQGEEPAWVQLYDPTRVLTLNFSLSEDDWNTVRFDTTNSIKVPAWFWADGEESSPLFVSIRRKSSRAVPSEADPQKVGLKVDINEFRSQLWRGVNKLSLENGADSDVVAEGLAWNLHRQAWQIYDYPGGHASAYAAWVRVNINGRYIGVYASVEQRNTQFLRNHGLYLKDRTWLYKMDDINGLELETGTGDSPTVSTLCFAPFKTGKKNQVCRTPSDAELATLLPQLIHMQGMLTQGAVDAFTSNPDALFSKGKNAFFADFGPGHPTSATRLYFPWDLDAVFRQVNDGIYGQVGPRKSVKQSPYQSVILNHPLFRRQYNQIMLDLIYGPLSVASLWPLLDQMEAATADALAEDPYPTLRVSPAQRFQDLKQWLADRIANVYTQVVADDSPPPRR